MRPAEPSEKNLIVDILAESFEPNPSVNYVVKQDAKRERRIKILMEYSYDVCNSFGEVWISENKEGCALILFPDEKRTSIASILGDLRLALLAIGIGRVGKVMSRESKIKAHHPKQPFAYLWFIGVKPKSQNKHLGSDLLKGLIQRYTSQGRPIYLETSVDRNLSWYTKHGFEIFKTLELTYSLYLLRRVI